MNKLFNIFLFLFIILGFTEKSVAQESNNDSADSLQRVIMKDSLNVNDSVITRVFTIKNNYLLRSAEINADATISENERTTAMQALITETNSGIRDALGAEAFEHYKQMIRRKSGSTGVNGRQPLASQIGN